MENGLIALPFVADPLDMKLVWFISKMLIELSTKLFSALHTYIVTLTIFRLFTMDAFIIKVEFRTI